ncbi:MAG: hypothetical protein ACRC6T_10025 [Sarcina sp.]
MREEDTGYEEYCALNKGKKVFLEKDVKDYLVQVEGDKIELENLTKKYAQLVDNSLRAEIIVTQDVERAKSNLEEVTEIYNFLIEEDEPNNWRVDLPLERDFIDIAQFYFREKN